MDYAEDQFSARRIGGIAFVVLLHVGIIYALVSGLGEQAVQVLTQPLQAKIIQEVKPPQLRPAAATEIAETAAAFHSAAVGADRAAAPAAGNCGGDAREAGCAGAETRPAGAR